MMTANNKECFTRENYLSAYTKARVRVLGEDGNFFLFRPKNYYKLSLRVTFSNTL